MRGRALLTAALCAAAMAATSCSSLARTGRSRGDERRQAVPLQVESGTAETPTAPRTDNKRNDAPSAPRVAATRRREEATASSEVRDASTPLHMPQWDTVNLFAYRGVSLADLPEVVAVELDEAHGYHAPAVGRLLSPYGRRSGRNHNGTDVAVAQGQPVYCAFDGVVRLSRWNSGGFGHIIIVRHPSGLETFYAHLSKRTVRAGEAVKAGQVIGLGGRTGRATANHLHFETRYCDQSFDAERLIDFTTGELKTRTLALRKEYFNINSHARDEATLAESGADALLAQAVPASEFVPPATAATTPTAASAAVPKAAASAGQPVYHKVRGGDTLYALARRYGTTVARLCSLNGISSRTTLRIGRSLRMK